MYENLLNIVSPDATFIEGGFWDADTKIKTEYFSISATIKNPNNDIGIHINSNIIFCIAKNLVTIKMVNIETKNEKILHSVAHNLEFTEDTVVTLNIKRENNILKFKYNEQPLAYSLPYNKIDIPFGIFGRKGETFTSIKYENLNTNDIELYGMVYLNNEEIIIENGYMIKNTSNLSEYYLYFGFEFVGDGVVEYFDENGDLLRSCDIKCVGEYSEKVPYETKNIRISSNTGLKVQKIQLVMSDYCAATEDYSGNIESIYSSEINIGKINQLKPGVCIAEDEYDILTDHVENLKNKIVIKPYGLNGFEIKSSWFKKNNLTIEHSLYAKIHCNVNDQDNEYIMDLRGLPFHRLGSTHGHLQFNEMDSYKITRNGEEITYSEFKQDIKDSSEKLLTEALVSLGIENSPPIIYKNTNTLYDVKKDDMLYYNGENFLINLSQTKIPVTETKSDKSIEYYLDKLDYNNDIGVSFDVSKASNWNDEKNEIVNLFNFTQDENTYLRAYYVRYKILENATKYGESSDGLKHFVYNDENGGIGDVELYDIITQNNSSEISYERDELESNVRFVHYSGDTIPNSGVYGSSDAGQIVFETIDSLGISTLHIVSVSKNMHFLEKDYYSRVFVNYSDSALTFYIINNYLLKLSKVSDLNYEVLNPVSYMADKGIINVNGELISYSLYKDATKTYMALEKDITSSNVILVDNSFKLNKTIEIEGRYAAGTNVSILPEVSGMNVDNIIIANTDNNLAIFENFVYYNIVEDYMYYTTFNGSNELSFINIFADNINPKYPISCYGYINGERVDYEQKVLLQNKNSIYEEDIVLYQSIIDVPANKVVTNVHTEDSVPIKFVQKDNKLYLLDAVNEGSNIVIVYYNPHSFCVNYSKGRYIITITNPIQGLKLDYSSNVDEMDYLDHINFNPFYENNNNGFLYISDNNGIQQIECEFNKNTLHLDGRDRICLTVKALGRNRSVSNNYNLLFYLSDNKKLSNKYVEVSYENIKTDQSGQYIVYINSKNITDTVNETQSLIVKDTISGIQETFKFNVKAGAGDDLSL